MDPGSCSNHSIFDHSVSAAQAAHDYESVSLLLHVESLAVRSIRESLHRSLGPGRKIHVVTVDRRHHRTSLQIETPRYGLGEVMSAIIAALPSAEFGPARSLRLA
jgi:hypothetical protein